jgi:signal recognition particle subunit SRP68
MTNATFLVGGSASAMYDKLSLAGSSHQEALCHATIDEIDPNIRFCGYRLRMAKDGVVNVDDLVRMSAANKGSGSDVLMREIEVCKIVRNGLI